MNLSETIGSHVKHLASGQNRDGGWGHEVGLSSSPMNSAEVMTAMLSYEDSASFSAAIDRAEAFILAAQRTDGGWSSSRMRSMPPDSGQTLATAWAVQALSRRPSSASATSLGQARNFLLARQASSGAWREYHEGVESVTATCHALLALAALDRGTQGDDRVKAAIGAGTAWLAVVHDEGSLSFVKDRQREIAPTVLAAHLAKTLEIQSFVVESLNPVSRFVLKAARGIEPSLFEESVEPEELRTFRFQYQHCTVPIVLRFLLETNEPISVLWPFLRFFWKLQQPGNGSSADRGGRRTTWATAQWIITACYLSRAASQKTELAKELPRIGAKECALIMKGGGVKGLALAGAIGELEEKGTRFDIVAGTSAGAIAAVLLAAGYTGRELEDILRKLDFRSFLDGVPRMALNLVTRRALHRGQSIGEWVSKLVRDKIVRVGSVRMRHLGRRAVIFAASQAEETITFDSHGEHRDTRADFAVRCSMSIPLFFVAHEHEGAPIYDGGLRHNFPVKKLLEIAPDVDFIGLYLRPSPPAKGLARFSLFSSVDIMLSQDETALVQEHVDKMVVIDPYPVKTTQFSLSNDEKEYLVWRGRAAARVFLQRRGSATQAEVDEADGKVAGYLEAITDARRKARRARVWILVIAAGAAVAALVARNGHVVLGRLLRSAMGH